MASAIRATTSSPWWAFIRRAGRRSRKGTIDAAVQLIPLNFVAFDAGYSNLGEVSDYIPEIVFTALIGDNAWLDGNRQKVDALLDSLRRGHRAAL